MIVYGWVIFSAQGDGGLGLWMAAKAVLRERCGCIGHDRPVSARQSPNMVAIAVAAWVIAAGTHSQAQETAPGTPSPPPYADFRLPVGAPARITIRYSVENAAARQRASDLARGLSEQGLDVAGPVASPGRIASSTVSYFYAEDRPGAEIAVRVLGPTWKIMQQRMPTREPFPRPGAIELAVAGP